MTVLLIDGSLLIECPISFSSQSMTERLSEDQQRHFLETGKRPIQERVQPKSPDLYGDCFKVTPLKCALSKQAPSWTEKKRTPTEGFFIFTFQILINANVAFTVSSLINPMESGFGGTAFVNRDN